MMLLRGQLILTEFVTLSEKIKNIFLWYHHRKTKEMLIVISILLAVLIFIPIKLILLIGIYKMFRRGLIYRTKVRETNKIILVELFHSILEEHNLQEYKAFLIDRNRPFEKKSLEYAHF
jgi:hypothetical protein